MIYRIYSINKATKEKESLDFSFNYGEAVKWCSEYAQEDEEARARGLCQGYYDYEIEEEEDEEE